MAYHPVTKVRLKAERIESEESVSIKVKHFDSDDFAFVDMVDDSGKANSKMLEWLYSRDDISVRTVTTSKEDIDMSINIFFE